jgi:hypothetical protein
MLKTLRKRLILSHILPVLIVIPFMGLTIARDLVVAHEGRLELESAPGLGIQITIWMPTRQRPMIPPG